MENISTITILPMLTDKILVKTLTFLKLGKKTTGRHEVKSLVDYLCR